MFRLLAAIITFIVAIVAILFLGVLVDLLKPFLIAAVIVLILIIAILKS